MPKPSAINEIWTEERVATLKRLWSEGVTASAIGDQIGATKNSVLGKVHKLKLASRKNSQNNTRSQQRDAGKANRNQMRASRPSNGRGNPQPHHVAAKIARKPVAIAPFDVEDNADATDVTHLIGVLGLTEQTCRWPVKGQGSAMLFCGVAKDRHAGPYCPEHSRRGGIQYDKGARP